MSLLTLARNLTGALPPKFVTNSPASLKLLDLSQNNFSGGNLTVVNLSHNGFSGTSFPTSLKNCRLLNSNELAGPVPPDLADQTGLIMPGSVSGKQFAFVRNEEGTECRGAGGLVEFEGMRKERLDSFPMVHSCPMTRIYTGVTVYTFASNGSMIYIDLSYNFLSGTIPEDYGSMGFLQVLKLGHDNFTGKIPDSFGGLKNLGVLDLSHNHPGSLGSLKFINDLDVSNNDLSGLIPSGGQLTTFPPSGYANNSGLCGVPLPPCSSGSGLNRPYNGVKKQSFEAGMVVGITFVATLNVYRNF